MQYPVSTTIYWSNFKNRKFELDHTSFNRPLPFVHRIHRIHRIPTIPNNFVSDYCPLGSHVYAVSCVCPSTPTHNSRTPQRLRLDSPGSFNAPAVASPAAKAVPPVAPAAKAAPSGGGDDGKGKGKGKGKGSGGDGGGGGGGGGGAKEGTPEQKAKAEAKKKAKVNRLHAVTRNYI